MYCSLACRWPSDKKLMGLELNECLHTCIEAYQYWAAKLDTYISRESAPMVSRMLARNLCVSISALAFCRRRLAAGPADPGA